MASQDKPETFASIKPEAMDVAVLIEQGNAMLSWGGVAGQWTMNLIAHIKATDPTFTKK